MKLQEYVTRPLEQSLKELTLTKVHVFSDDEGNVRAIELKYEEISPLKEKDKPKTTSW